MGNDEVMKKLKHNAVKGKDQLEATSKNCLFATLGGVAALHSKNNPRNINSMSAVIFLCALSFNKNLNF